MSHLVTFAARANAAACTHPETRVLGGLLLSGRLS